MRISRRTSRTTAVPRGRASALRRTTAAGAALSLAVLAATACSSSSKPADNSPTSSSGQADPNANENDIQILNSLQLTASELDTAFATDHKWQPWTNYDASKLLIKQAQACTAGIIDTKAQTLPPITTAFRADKLPGETAPPASSAPTSTPTATKSSPGHKGTSTPTAPASSPAGNGGTPVPAPDQNPAHWVVSTAIIYQTADAAHSAVNGMGKVTTNTVGCGGPGDDTAIVGSGIGEVGPSWFGSMGVFVYADTKSSQAVSVVAQRRGRYVVLTYTRGYAAKQEKAQYYDLESVLPDTAKAADAATGVLGQLTDAVVNR